MRRILPLVLASIVSTVLIASGIGCSESEPRDPELSKAELQRQAAPASVKKLLLAANRAYERSEYQRALVLVDSAEKRAPDLADVHFLRGRILTDLRQYEKAQKAYAQVVELASDYRGVLFNMANNAFRQGQSEEAVTLYRRALERQQRPKAYVNMGRAYARLSKPDSARWAYEQALKMKDVPPARRAEAHGWLSQLLDNGGQPEQALEHARAALKLDPDNPNYRYRVGALLYKLNRYEEAVEPLRAVTKTRPWHYSAHYNLGQTLARLGRQEEARRYLTKADSLEELQSKIKSAQRAAYQNPSNVMAWVDYGSVLRRARRYEEAIKAYQIALNLTPGNLPLMDNIANLHMAVGDTTEAIRRYRRILRRDSSMARTWLNLGVAYAQTGRLEEARRAWESALEHRPDYERARRYLAQISEGRDRGRRQSP